MKERSFAPERESEPSQKSSGSSKSKKLLAASLLAGGMALGAVQDIEAKMPKATHNEQSEKIRQEKGRNHYVKRLQELEDPQGGGFTDDEEGNAILDRSDAPLIIQDLAKIDMHAAWNTLDKARIGRKPYVKELDNYFYEFCIKNKDVSIFIEVYQTEAFYPEYRFSESQIQHLFGIFLDVKPTAILDALFVNYYPQYPNLYNRYKEKSWLKDIIYQAIDIAVTKQKEEITELFNDVVNFYPPSEYKHYAEKRGIILKK